MTGPTSGPPGAGDPPPADGSPTHEETPASGQRSTGGDQPAEAPGWAAGSSDRQASLAAYLARHGTTYTSEALGQAAREAGFTEDEIARATERVRAAETLRPIRNQARWIVVGAYALVWDLFATVYLTRQNTFGTGFMLQVVLTAALLLVLLVGLLWVARVRPDPTRTGRALLILLVVPVVLLVGVAGLCVPFLGMSG
jgi:hypothetical protein